jgi:hypothetical protein
MLFSLSVSAGVTLITMVNAFTAHARQEAIRSASGSPVHTAPHMALALTSPGVGTNHVRIVRLLGRQQLNSSFTKQQLRY